MPGSFVRGGFSAGRTAPATVRQAAAGLLRQRLSAYGIRLEVSAAGVRGGYTARLRDGQEVALKLLAAAAPHRRGGRGSLGLHWLLASDDEEYVALVDLSRASGWLLPAADFRARAQLLPSGYFHLDWLVVRLGKSRVADEEEFERYRWRVAMARYLLPHPRRLTQAEPTLTPVERSSPPS